MKYETICLNEKRNVTLTSFILPVGGEFRNIPARPAILILPGGGYGMCSEREAEPVAMSYLAAGYNAFILRYSVREHRQWPNPLDDYEQAMSYIREHAKKWHILPDKIAVIGFSAGGHLAAAAATMAKNRPNAAVLGYAVVTEDVIGCNDTAPDTVGEVDLQTPPCFLFHARCDGTVPVENSLRFMTALAQKGITFESHIYGFGPHGFSKGDSSLELPRKDFCSRIPNWVADSIGFLKDVFGDFGPDGLDEPRCSHFINGNFEPMLSGECTLIKLSAIPEAAQAIRGVVSKAMTFDGSKATLEGMVSQFPHMMFCDICGFSLASAEEKQAALDTLSQIPNPDYEG